MATISLKDQRVAIIDEARGIAQKAKDEGRLLTHEENEQIAAKGAEVTELDKQIAAADASQGVLDQLGKSADQHKSNGSPSGSKAKTLGEHAVKAFDGALGARKGRNFTLDAGEFAGGVKAAGDPHTVTSTGAGVLQPQIDTSIVHTYKERPTIADWLGSGTLTSTAITYFIENDFDPSTGGNFGIVGENEKKPGITFPDYENVTETLKKIAGWIKVSDEMSEDLSFLASEVNNRLLYQLLMFEEDQLLNGTGTGVNVRGILNRSGVQTETAANDADLADAIFRARTKVSLATGLEADGLVMHPLDYQKLRLSKDANGQYFAGGPFAGQYGNGGIVQNPPIWGLSNTIITTAVEPGTALVGAGKQAATVYRKGGIRVEASNVDGEDFTYNRFTILAEERLTLAVRRPSAFVKVSVAEAPAG